MLDTIALAARRHRSPGDYRRFQTKLAQHSVAQLRRLGLDFSTMRVLELGSGGGGYSVVLAEHCPFLVAADLHGSPFYVASSISFVQMNASGQFPFRDSSFDLVYCSSLIEHLSDPSIMLRQCLRVLRPGGIMYVSFPPFYSLWLVGGHQFKPFHLFGERAAIAATNSIRHTSYRSYANAYGDFGLVPLRIRDVSHLLREAGFCVDRVFTRLSNVNTASFPGVLADLFTWHACFLASPSSEPKCIH